MEKVAATRLLLLKTKLPVVDSSYRHLNRYQKNPLREKICHKPIRTQEEKMIMPPLMFDFMHSL